MGHSGNGELLRRLRHSFDVSADADRRMQYQQKLKSFRNRLSS